MFVAPSSVLYTACPGSPGLGDLTSEKDIEELSRKLMANFEGLRLQVVEKDGHYFTLNNTRLQVCRWLETRGQCRTVRIETVPLTAVPEGIKTMMVVPSDKGTVPAASNERFMTITYEPMEKRPRTARDDDTEDHTDSDDSGGEDSDSLCDEFEIREQQQRRRRQSTESGEEEDTSLL